MAFDTIKYDKLISCPKEDLGITSDGLCPFKEIILSMYQYMVEAFFHSRSCKVCHKDYAWDLFSLLLTLVSFLRLSNTMFCKCTAMQMMCNCIFSFDPSEFSDAVNVMSNCIMDLRHWI